MGANKRVLIIDDSRVSRMKLRQLLLQRQPDWQVVEAGSGEEGVQAATGAIPDLITVDINMPGMGGLAAIEQLRAACPEAHIVMLSGNIQDSSKASAAQLGVAFFEKPITDAVVTAVLSGMRA